MTDPRRGHYSKWVGVVMGMILPGAAHYLSGSRRAGILWLLGLAVSGVVCIMLMIPPGMAFYVSAIAILLARALFWLIMLIHSYRPVPRIDLSDWLMVGTIGIIVTFSARPLLTTVIHPFRIPSGAMSPTVMGTRKVPLSPETPRGRSLRHWLMTGEASAEILAPEAGVFEGPAPLPGPDGSYQYQVGNTVVGLPRCSPPVVPTGTVVKKGDVLWAGAEIAGDHVLVEKLSYRFGSPQRGDIVVVDMKDITGSEIFYIRRVAAIPGETVSISPPHLLVNNEPVSQPQIFAEISSRTNGHAGFMLAPKGLTNAILDDVSKTITLGDDEYFLLGDRTISCTDSRFWGAAPRKSIVGRVARVYWPFNRVNALDDN
jgi:signal peptidase I